MACHEPGTLARIEDQRIALLLVAMAMGMPMEDQIDAIRPIGACVLWVMEHEDSPTGPVEGPWR